jgi:hypothetical protein
LCVIFIFYQAVLPEYFGQNCIKNCLFKAILQVQVPQLVGGWKYQDLGKVPLQMIWSLEWKPESNKLLLPADVACRKWLQLGGMINVQERVFNQC